MAKTKAQTEGNVKDMNYELMRKAVGKVQLQGGKRNSNSTPNSPVRKKESSFGLTQGKFI